MPFEVMPVVDVAARHAQVWSEPRSNDKSSDRLVAALGSGCVVRASVQRVIVAPPGASIKRQYARTVLITATTVAQGFATPIFTGVPGRSAR